MGQDANQIRREIEETRARMGDTVEAIGYKADVPSRVRDNVNERIASVKGTIGDAVSGTKEAVFGTARERAGDTSESTKRAVSVAMENPLGLALGALALGFLGGLVLPVSDLERERIGPVREQIAGRAQAAVAEAVDAGKSVLQETLATASESAQKHGAEVAQHAVAGTPLEQSMAASGQTSNVQPQTPSSTIE